MQLDRFSERLAALRIAKGVSARDMSLSIGQSANYINKIENRKTFPSMTVFFYICEYLNVTPAEFFEDSNKNPQRLNDLVMDLMRLDDAALSSLAGVVRELLGRR